MHSQCSMNHMVQCYTLTLPPIEHSGYSLENMTQITISSIQDSPYACDKKVLEAAW
jgi:hypothetical protein